MFDFYGINKPGKGVDKRDPNQPRFSLYLELLFDKIWRLCKTNLLYVLWAIPTFVVTMFIVGVVTSSFTDSAAAILQNSDAANQQNNIVLFNIDLSARAFVSLLFMVFLGMGPITAGITYVLRNYATEEHTWLMTDAWRIMKSNFKQAILLWIIDLVFFVVMATAFNFYSQIGGFGNVIVYVLFFVVLLYLMAHIYIYRIMISFSLPFKALVKNAIIISGATAPKTLLLLIFQAIVHIVIPFMMLTSGVTIFGMTIFVMLEVLVLPTFTAFTNNFFINNSIEKYLIGSNDNN